MQQLSKASETPPRGGAKPRRSSPSKAARERSQPSDDPREAVGTQELVEALFAVSRAFVALAARSLSDTASEVTLHQYRALVVLSGAGEGTPATLARELGITPSTATRLVDRLVRKGYVTRRQDRGDRRRVLLRLTPGGTALVDEVSARRRRELSRIVREAGLPVDDATLRTLARLAAVVGETPDQDWTSGWHQSEPNRP